MGCVRKMVKRMQLLSQQFRQDDADGAFLYASCSASQDTRTSLKGEHVPISDTFFFPNNGRKPTRLERILGTQWLAVPATGQGLEALKNARTRVLQSCAAWILSASPPSCRTSWECVKPFADGSGEPQVDMGDSAF